MKEVTDTDIWMRKTIFLSAGILVNVEFGCADTAVHFESQRQPLLLELIKKTQKMSFLFDFARIICHVKWDC